MSLHLNYRAEDPAAYAALSALERYVRQTGLDRSMLELMKIRASQINGCAYCLDMHTRDARAAGESEQRLAVLPAWRETTFFSPAERAALALTENVTRIAEGGVSEAVAAELRQQFTGPHIVQLTMAVITINAWNRIAIATGSTPTAAAEQARPRATGQPR